MFPVFVWLFLSLLLDCAVFLTSTLVTLAFGLFTESWEVWNITQLCLFWNYHRYSILCFTACIQLVKVSTVIVFLERGLLVQDTESQEDQYQFEICLSKHSAKFAIRLLFPVFPVIQATLQLDSARI